MKNFSLLTPKIITGQIEMVERLTVHEVDCLFDLHFTVDKAEITDNDTYLVIKDTNRGWFTLALDSVVEFTFSDGLTVIVVGQNLFRKDV